MSRERPILMSAPMVLALLAGRKTQTRRILKTGTTAPVVEPWEKWEPGVFGSCATDGTSAIALSRYGDAGDRLWVRETWLLHESNPNGLTVAKFAVADGEEHWRVPTAKQLAAMKNKTLSATTKRPSIFMPRWASRLLLEVTSVRVERLQDISRDDAIAEGLERRAGSPNWFWPGGPEGFGDPRACYLRGWDTVNGKGSAASNPHVWVVSFKAVTK